jgi:hypothetical protein
MTKVAGFLALVYNSVDAMCAAQGVDVPQLIAAVRVLEGNAPVIHGAVREFRALVQRGMLRPPQPSADYV